MGTSFRCSTVLVQRNMHEQIDNTTDNDTHGRHPTCSGRFFSASSTASIASRKPRGIRCVSVNRSLLVTYCHRQSCGIHALQHSNTVLKLVSGLFKDGLCNYIIVTRNLTESVVVLFWLEFQSNNC